MGALRRTPAQARAAAMAAQPGQGPPPHGDGTAGADDGGEGAGGTRATPAPGAEPRPA
jgi:hypothetical protein